MKKTILLLAAAGSFVLIAQAVRADAPVVPAAQPVQAEPAAVPSEGFSSSRYEILWTKSPFAVATAEAVQDSPDYSMVGIAQFDGISYASLIETHSNDHFLVSSDKPTRGLTLSSITRGKDGSDTLAVVQKDGQPITLKLVQAPAAPVLPNAQNAQGGVSIPMPAIMTPQITMPGAGGSAPGVGSTRPMIPRIHRPIINLPPRPAQQQQPQPQPVQAHPAPPPPQ